MALLSAMGNAHYKECNNLFAREVHRNACFEICQRPFRPAGGDLHTQNNLKNLTTPIFITMGHPDPW
jgi:hypothetical protein